MYSWCALIQYIFATYCKSPFELKTWSTMNSPPKFSILVFLYEVQSLETTLSMCSTFSNYGGGVEWYWNERKFYLVLKIWVIWHITTFPIHKHISSLFIFHCLVNKCVKLPKNGFTHGFTDTCSIYNSISSISNVLTNFNI